MRDVLLARHGLVARGLVARECSNKAGSTETYLRLAAHGQAATDWLASALDKALAEPLSARSRGRHGEAG